MPGSGKNALMKLARPLKKSIVFNLKRLHGMSVHCIALFCFDFSIIPNTIIATSLMFRGCELWAAPGSHLQGVSQGARWDLCTVFFCICICICTECPKVGKSTSSPSSCSSIRYITVTALLMYDKLLSQRWKVYCLKVLIITLNH